MLDWLTVLPPGAVLMFGAILVPLLPKEVAGVVCPFAPGAISRTLTWFL